MGAGFIGLLLVLIAAGSIVGVMWVVMREKHDHEDHYIVPPPSEKNSDTSTTE